MPKQHRSWPHGKPKANRVPMQFGCITPHGIDVCDCLAVCKLMFRFGYSIRCHTDIQSPYTLPCAVHGPHAAIVHVQRRPNEVKYPTKACSLASIAIVYLCCVLVGVNTSYKTSTWNMLTASPILKRMRTISQSCASVSTSGMASATFNVSFFFFFFFFQLFILSLQYSHAHTHTEADSNSERHSAHTHTHTSMPYLSCSQCSVPFASLSHQESFKQIALNLSSSISISFLDDDVSPSNFHKIILLAIELNMAIQMIGNHLPNEILAFHLNLSTSNNINEMFHAKWINILELKRSKRIRAPIHEQSGISDT